MAFQRGGFSVEQLAVWQTFLQDPAKWSLAHGGIGK